MKEIDVKTERVVARLSNEGLKGILINSQHNFAWITCGASNGIDLSRDAGAASILVTREGKRYLLTNNIEMQRMLDGQVSSDDFEPVEYAWQSDKASPSFLIDKAKEVAGGGVATDSAAEVWLAGCRYSLTGEEIERYRRLGKDAAEALLRTANTISPGMTEEEISNVMRYELGRDNIFSTVTLVAADNNIAKYRHPVPSSDRWEKSLLLVTCAKTRRPDSQPEPHDQRRRAVRQFEIQNRSGCSGQCISPTRNEARNDRGNALQSSIRRL